MYKYKREKLKKRLIIISSLLTLITLSTSFILLYNEVIKPFEHKVHYTDVTKNDDVVMRLPFYSAYVKNQFDKYECSIFSRQGKNCILPQITLIFCDYTLKSYNITIELGEDYEKTNNEIKSKLPFISTPIGHGDSLYFIDYLKINDWIFKEIKFNYEWYEENEMMNWYYNNIRVTSYWYGFNEQTKQISFSILEHYSSLDYYSDEESLIKYMKKNLPV